MSEIRKIVEELLSLSKDQDLTYTSNESRVEEYYKKKVDQAEQKLKDLMLSEEEIKDLMLSEIDKKLKKIPDEDEIVTMDSYAKAYNQGKFDVLMELSNYFKRNLKEVENEFNSK